MLKEQPDTFSNRINLFFSVLYEALYITLISVKAT